MQHLDRIGMALLTGLAALAVGPATATADPWGDPVFYRVSDEVVLDETGDLLVDEEFPTNIPNVHLPSDGSGRNLLVETGLGQIAAQREIRISYYIELVGPTSTTVRVAATGQRPRGCSVHVDAVAPNLNAP